MKSLEDESFVFLSDRLHRRLQVEGFQEQRIGNLIVFSKTENNSSVETIGRFERFIEENGNNLRGRCVDLSYEAINNGLANTIFTGFRNMNSDVTPGGVHYVPGFIGDNGDGVAVDVTSKPIYFAGNGHPEIEGVAFVGTEDEIVRMLDVGLQGNFSRFDPD
jgi:hypothetical protein